MLASTPCPLLMPPFVWIREFVYCCSRQNTALSQNVFLGYKETLTSARATCWMRGAP